MRGVRPREIIWPIRCRIVGRLYGVLALAGVGFLQLVADLFSALALLALLQQPSPPVALVIGYWLTTAGLVAGTGGIQEAPLRFGRGLRRGRVRTLRHREPRCRKRRDRRGSG